MSDMAGMEFWQDSIPLIESRKIEELNLPMNKSYLNEGSEWA